MFEPVVRDDCGRVIDPRDVRATRAVSLFCASQLDRFASVLSANVEALEEDNQLELGSQLTSCAATLEWMKCRVASSLAVKDAASPIVRHAENKPGEPILRALGGDGTPEVSEFLIPEVALAFVCSEREATAYLSVGLDLRFRLRCTNAELGGGRINYACAKVISEETRHLSAEVAETLDAVLADAAATRTPARLRVLARKKAAAADPAALVERHLDAVANRGTAMFSIGDGMGAFCVNGPLETMAVVEDSVDAWARRLRSQFPALPLAAHRADAATRLLLGQHPLTGQAMFSSGQPASTAEYAVRHDSAAGTAASGGAAAGGVEAGGVEAGGVDGTAGEQPHDQAAVPPTGWLPARTELRVSMTADTLLGLDEATCDLQGYGPITAAQARRLALQSASLTLRRVFTDPADNSILFLDAGRYRFTREQVEAIATLHPLSTFPGATNRTSRCDVDHILEYRTGPPDAAAQRGSAGGQDPPGQTVVTNGQPLVRRHHRLKTHGGWKVRADPGDPHTFHWISPRGRTYISNDTDGS